MTSLETLQTSVTNLNNQANKIGLATDAVVSHINTPPVTDAQIVSIAGTIDAITASLASNVTRLNDAVNPPTT